MKGYKVLMVATLLIQLGGGKDLYWKPNSNWGNPNNWASGRVPACGESVSLQNVPDKSVIYLDRDTTVGSIVLPENGQILLGESVTIKLTPDTECTVSGASPPMAAPVNEFVGAATNYWECSQNWMTSDGSSVEHAPCADDNAVFDKGYFSFVEANVTIYVRSVTVRGTSVKSPSELTTMEFKLKLEVNPKCGDNPSLCPCPDDSQCPKSPPTKALPTPKAGVRNASTGGVVAGVLIPIFVIVIVALVVIAVVVTIYKNKMKITYVKEDLVEEPAHESDGKGVYDNPLFSDDVKVDLGNTMADVPDDKGVSFEYEGDSDVDKKKKTKEPKMNEYERF